MSAITIETMEVEASARLHTIEDRPHVVVVCTQLFDAATGEALTDPSDPLHREVDAETVYRDTTTIRAVIPDGEKAAERLTVLRAAGDGSEVRRDTVRVGDGTARSEGRMSLFETSLLTAPASLALHAKDGAEDFVVAAPKTVPLVGVQSPSNFGGPSPLALVADDLLIDRQRGRALVTWRGSFQLPEAKHASSLVVHAMSHTHGTPSGWPPPQQALLPSLAPKVAARDVPPSSTGTVTLSDAMALQAIEKPVMPFDQRAPKSDAGIEAPPPESAPESTSGTVLLGDHDLSDDVLPFQK